MRNSDCGIGKRLCLRPLQCIVLLHLLSACLIGCSKPPFDVAPVSGKVTIDGQPMAAGQVMFAPLAKAGSINAGKPGFGRIESDGSYILSTYGNGDGAVVGEHTVTIYNTTDTPTFSEMLIPGRRAVMAGQDNQIDIEITTDDIRRYGETVEDD